MATTEKSKAQAQDQPVERIYHGSTTTCVVCGKKIKDGDPFRSFWKASINDAVITCPKGLVEHTKR